MQKIGFIGVYDKTDLILSIAKVLVSAGKKVCILDLTTTQKCKYVVPVINPTKSYITDFDGIDVAIGFDSLEEIKQYLGIENSEKMEYDVMLFDIDNYNSFLKFDLKDADKLYYTTSFDAYSLKKGIELLKQINIPIRMTRLFYSKEMLFEEEQYFEYLTLGLRVVWDEDKLYFLLENGDQAALIENQRLQKIKFRNLSQEYRDNVEYIVNILDGQIGRRKVKDIIKNL